MNLRDGFAIQALRTENEIQKVILHFSSYFPEHELSGEFRFSFAKKLSKFGILFAAYLDDELMGFISGYVNDHETKTVHVNSLAISHEAGLLRGVICKYLLTSFSAYAKEQGLGYCTAEVADNNIYAKEQYLRMGAEVFDRNSEHPRVWLKFNDQIFFNALNNAERKENDNCNSNLQ